MTQDEYVSHVGSLHLTTCSHADEAKLFTERDAKELALKEDMLAVSILDRLVEVESLLDLTD